MISKTWDEKKIMRQMKLLRIEDKVRENSLKPLLSSPDVANTLDFVFSPIKPSDRVGDSGPLLIGKHKINRSERYLVKHACCDCACNEFVYTKIAQAMNYKMPDVVLLRVPPEEKRRCFGTEYIIGAKYLNIINDAPAFSTIKERALNWREYFSFRALYALTGEGDSFETPLADDGFIYRVDTTDAFPTDEFILSQAGINIEVNGRNNKEFWESKLLNMDINNHWQKDNLAWWLNQLAQTHGKECIAPFLEPLARIQDISTEYVDGFLHTLCYFYPDFIGVFFKKYISALQKFAGEYLKAK